MGQVEFVLGAVIALKLEPFLIQPQQFKTVVFVK